MNLPTDPAKNEASETESNRLSNVTVPLKRDQAAVYMAVCWAMAFFIVYSGSPDLFGWLVAALFFACGLLFAAGAVSSGGCQSGVRLFDGGFEQYRGIWPAIKVYYARIDRIEAVQTAGGAQGDEVMLLVFSEGQKVRIGQHDLFSTDLRHHLFALPGFQREQYALAANHVVKGLEHFNWKKFLVFQKPQKITRVEAE